MTTEREPKQPTPAGSLRPYQAPRLLIYGPVRELTGGGSGNAVEGTKGVGGGEGLRRP